MSEFGNSIVCEQGFKNLVENEEIVGFQVRVRISYYRGIPLCLLAGYEIEVDGEEFTDKDIQISVDGGKVFYPVTDLDDLRDVRWEYGDKAYLHIKKPGGLARGVHTVKITQHVNVPYLPFATGFFQTKRLTIV